MQVAATCSSSWGLRGGTRPRSLGFGGQAMAQEMSVAFWATATLDIADKWQKFAELTGVTPEFTDNGNDIGPVVARLAAGNANDLLMSAASRAALKGNWPGRAHRGLGPFQNPELCQCLAMGKGHSLPPARRQTDRHSHRRQCRLDHLSPRQARQGHSYGVIFDPKLKGRVAMEDAWINSAIFTAMYLKEAENQPIKDPGNLSESELAS